MLWTGLGQPTPRINHPQWVMHIEKTYGETLNIREIKVATSTVKVGSDELEDEVLIRIEDFLCGNKPSRS